MSGHGAASGAGGWLGAREAARRLGIHVNSLKRLDPAKLPFIRVFDRGDRRYRDVDVEAYIEQRTVGR